MAERQEDLEELELAQSEEVAAYNAKEARYLLQHPVVKEADRRTEARIMAQWRRATTLEERERCWIKLQMLLEWKQERRAFADSPLPKP